MSSHPVTSPAELAATVTPLNEEMAAKLFAAASAADDSVATAAVFYPYQHESGTLRKASMLITLTLTHDSLFSAFVTTGEYSPRLRGKAELIFESAVTVHESD